MENWTNSLVGKLLKMLRRIYIDIVSLCFDSEYDESYFIGQDEDAAHNVFHVRHVDDSTTRKEYLNRQPRHNLIHLGIRE